MYIYIYIYIYTHINVYTDNPQQPSPSSLLSSAFLSEGSRTSADVIGPLKYFHWQSDRDPSTGPLPPKALIPGPLQKINPDYLVNPSYIALPFRVARRCGQSYIGLLSLDAKDTHSCVFTLIHPTSIAQRRIRVGWVGQNSFEGEAGGAWHRSEPYSATDTDRCTAELSVWRARRLP